MLLSRVEKPPKGPLSPVTIVHAEDHSVEVNDAGEHMTIGAFFALVQAKEQEMMQQKEVLESLKAEFAELRDQVESEEDPDMRRELINDIFKINHAIRGKKAIFLENFRQWKMTMMEHDRNLKMQVHESLYPGGEEREEREPAC